MAAACRPLTEAVYPNPASALFPLLGELKPFFGDLAAGKAGKPYCFTG